MNGVAAKDGLEAFWVENIGFNELKEPGFVFGPSDLKGYGCKMFRGEHARRGVSHRNEEGFDECFLHKRSRGGRICTGQPAITTYSPSMRPP